MTNDGRKFRRGITKLLAAYFQQHANKVISIADLEKAFPDWTRHQILHALAHGTLHKKGANTNPILKRVERLDSGVWRLVDKTVGEPVVGVQDTSVPPHPLEQPGPKLVALPTPTTPDIYDMTVTVIRETDDGSEMVAVDPFTNIWRMVKVG